jgi:hypothetical protein
MMGTKARVFTPITALSLDKLVPADHFYRHLDRVLDLSFVRDLVLDCYAVGIGRPSVDPVVFFRLQLVMFFEGIDLHHTQHPDGTRTTEVLRLGDLHRLVLHLLGPTYEHAYLVVRDHTEGEP